MKLNYRVWDNKNKSYFQENDKPIEFENETDAYNFRDEWLAFGNYIDEPITVIHIYEFEGDEFIKGCEEY